MKPQLPAPTEGAADVAKLAPGVGSAIASIWFPEAAFAGPVLNFAIDKFVERPTRILMEALREGDVTLLTDEKRAEFIPMAYRFMEAAKEGEYEHNLRVLGAYIAQELQQDVSEASNVARLARRIEGLSSVEIKVIALVASSLSSITYAATDMLSEHERPFVSVNNLVESPNNKNHLGRFEIEEALNDLSSRGLLITHGGISAAKTEEWYYASDSFKDLTKKAKLAIELVAEPDPGARPSFA